MVMMSYVLLNLKDVTGAQHAHDVDEAKCPQRTRASALRTSVRPSLTHRLPIPAGPRPPSAASKPPTTTYNQQECHLQVQTPGLSPGTHCNQTPGHLRHTEV